MTDIELRPREDGSFDELISQGCDVHFETMSKTCLWVSVRKGDTEYHLFINSSKGKLTIECNDESARNEPLPKD